MKFSKKEILLKNRLNKHYKNFDFSQISPDPLEFPHRFKNPLDIEISAFISATFAYGNIKQIIATLEKIHRIMGKSPHQFVMNFSKKDEARFKGVIHRFYNTEDIITLFKILKIVYQNYGSLKFLFLLYYFEEEKNLKESISFFSCHMLDLGSKIASVTPGVKFMFPSPYNNSPCKRINLFLRWMVRRDALDFGLWNEILPAKLIIPVDTHIAKICTNLKLTKRKNITWLMAEEITENLKKYDSIDPVKYDFALCHIGMRNLKF